MVRMIPSPLTLGRRVAGCCLAGLALAAAAHAADPPPRKNLLLPGEALVVAERPAFLFAPAYVPRHDGPRPWILYAPTLPDCPDEAERWMHEQFTAAGVAVAGIDTGESFGSPAAVQATEALHAEMVRRGYARRPAVLGRSRGGLWAAAWALAHPELTAGLGGIYPVYDWRTYPGAERAAAAYGLSPADLEAQSSRLCPVERTRELAAAGIPVCIIHGDQDDVVPLAANSAALQASYAAAGRADLVNLLVAEGQGHSYWEGFFRCPTLVDFLIERARAGASE